MVEFDATAPGKVFKGPVAEKVSTSQDMAEAEAVLPSESGSVKPVEPEAPAARSRIVALIAGNRWFWIPPLYVLALVIVVIVPHSRGSDAAQLMYRNF